MIQNNKFIGQIGVGYWGKNLLRDFLKIGVLKTVCEINPTIIDNIKKDYPDLQVTDDWKQVLNDNNITAVVISLEAEHHYKFAKEALENNKDVFVEKPLSLNLHEAEELVKLAEQKNKILMVGHVLRYHPCIKKIEEIVKNKIIGDLYYIDCSRKNLGKIRHIENVLWSFAPHDISLVLALVNNAKPLNIKCFGQKHLNNNIDDVTDTFLEFPGNCFAHISVNWLHPFKEQRTTIVGSEGMLVFDDTKPNDEKLTICKKYLSKKPGEYPEVNKSEFTNVTCDWSENKFPLQLECEHFVHCCKTRQTPLTDGFEGLQVLKILDTCHKQLTCVNTYTTKEIKNDYFVHDTAIIGENAVIGNGSKIWHNTHIQGGKIGNNCSIGQGCYMAPDSTLGNNCKVQNNVSIYSGIHCEDNVFLGPSMVFCNDINPRAAFSKNGHYMKTLVKEGASIGANATILPGITIGKCAFIGAGAVVTKNVPDYALMVGNPAKQISVMDEKGNYIKNDIIKKI
jgi:UDP-2-acetamido-3-amino-2,3-dideoxy-glucuronate N-acetyltransferase